MFAILEIIKKNVQHFWLFGVENTHSSTALIVRWPDRALESSKT